MTTYDLLSDGAAVAAVADEPTDDQLPVHGVLFGPDDVTTGLSGKRTRWPADVLEAMAEDGVFEGKPFTLAPSLDPEQHVGVELTEDGPQLTGVVSMDEKVGEVTATTFDTDAGLLFEGFLADWDAEDAVEAGLAQISPVVMRDVELVEGEEGDSDALYDVTNVEAVRDVALVADGAVPSNEINVGQSPAMGAGMAEALSAHYGVDVEALADGAANTGGDDGSRGGSSQSTRPSGWRSSMTDDDLTDKERELLAAAGQKDDPTVVEAGLLEELETLRDDNEELIETAADLDDPTVESAEEIEAMQNRLGSIESMFNEALTEERGLRETTVEAMSFEAKAAEFETDEGDLDVEALTQSPETGSAPTGGSDGDPLADLDEEARDEVEAAKSRFKYWDGKNDTIADAEKQTMVEALSVDSFDDVDLEAI